jgi:nucleolin
LDSQPRTKISTAQKAAPNDDSHDNEVDSSEDDKPKAQQIQTVPKPANSPDEESSSSSEDSDSDSDSDSDTPPKPPTATLKKVQQAGDSSSDSDSSCSEGSSSSGSDEDAEMEDHTPAVVTTGRRTAVFAVLSGRSLHHILGKRKAEDGRTPPAKKAKTTNGPSTVAEPEGGLTKTVFVGNLSWAVDNDRLSQEFADCGEVISARVQLDRNTGRSRGFGYVTFATTEAVDAAIALNGTKEIDGRTLNLDKSVDVGPNREKRAQAFGEVRSAPSKVLFVGNLSWNTVEDTLWDAFSEYGDVNSVRLPTDRETGKPKGYGYIEFGVVDSAQKAMDAMNGGELDGRSIRLDFSQPRDANGTGHGRGGGRGRGGFDGGRGRGGFDGGFDGGRGRGGFDGGRGRGGGRVRCFTLSKIHNSDNLLSQGRGGDRGRGRGGARGGMRTGAIAASEGRKITF